MKLTRVVWQEMVKILNVAEKNDAAKSIAGLLSRGSSRMVTKIDPPSLHFNSHPNIK